MIFWVFVTTVKTEKERIISFFIVAMKVRRREEDSASCRKRRIHFIPSLPTFPFLELRLHKKQEIVPLERYTTTFHGRDLKVKGLR